MAQKYKTTAFVFAKNDLGDAGRIFSVFSCEFGRLEIYGKAIRKIDSKLKAGIDLFYFSEIEFIEGKNRKTLTDAITHKKFKNILCSPDKTEIAERICEVLGSFVRGQEKDGEIFGLLKEVFERLDGVNEKKQKLEIIYCYFLWNFLARQGYSPEVFKCASCGMKLNPYGIYFSCKEGGVVCKRCLKPGADAQKINSDIVKVLRVILDGDWQILSRLKMEDRSRILLGSISEAASKSFCPA